MGYNVVDIINKAIKVTIKEKNIYENVKKEKYDTPIIKAISNVLIKETKKNIEFYENLKKEMEKEKLDDIEFGIYDKISFLVNQFNNKEYLINFDDVKEYLVFSLNVEKDIESLLIDIQGRLVKNISDTELKTYKTLSLIINNKKEYIDKFQKLINK